MTKKILAFIISLLLILAMTVSTFAAERSSGRFVYDDANLLSSYEESNVSNRLEELSRKHNTEIVIVTVDYLGGSSINSFINNFYDVNDLGYGDTRDGVLLVVCMSMREFRILSNGKAADKISLDDIDSISDSITPYLSDGDYEAAFLEFADLCGDQLGFNVLKHLLISAVIGLVIGLIVALILKAQLKSVRRRYTAHEYIRPGSVNVRPMGDFFLYSNVSRTRRQSSSSSGGGGGSRSSGGSRNVGGGRF